MGKLNKKKNNTSNEKTYSIKFLSIVVFLFIMVFMALIFLRDYKADILVIETKELDREIKELKKQVQILKAEEVKYSAPNRLTAIGFESGLNEITTREDVIYLKIDNQ